MNASERKLVRKAVELSVWEHSYKASTETCTSGCLACQTQRQALAILDAEACPQCNGTGRTPKSPAPSAEVK